MPRRPRGSLGKRPQETEKALTLVLKTLPRAQEQLNWLEQQLRGTQTLVLEHDAEVTAARAQSEG